MNQPDKECQTCDYKNAVRHGRADWRCRDCGRQLMLELVLMHEAENQDKEKKLELRDWLPDFKKFFILLFGVMLPWILLLSLLTNGLCD